MIETGYLNQFPERKTLNFQEKLQQSYLKQGQRGRGGGGSNAIWSFSGISSKYPVPIVPKGCGGFLVSACFFWKKLGPQQGENNDTMTGRTTAEAPASEISASSLSAGRLKISNCSSTTCCNKQTSPSLTRLNTHNFSSGLTRCLKTKHKIWCFDVEKKIWFCEKLKHY